MSNSHLIDLLTLFFDSTHFHKFGKDEIILKCESLFSSQKHHSQFEALYVLFYNANRIALNILGSVRTLHAPSKYRKLTQNKIWNRLTWEIWLKEFRNQITNWITHARLLLVTRSHQYRSTRDIYENIKFFLTISTHKRMIQIFSVNFRDIIPYFQKNVHLNVALEDISWPLLKKNQKKV